MKEDNTPQRIAKIIARSGFCSRRNAESLIEQGKVKVDGVVVETPALKITNQNKILINDQPINRQQKTRLWIFNKPKAVLVTDYDPQGRTILKDVLPDNLPRVIAVGRLDYNSEGLLLLTNDGEFSRKLELPSNKFVRKYHVRAFSQFCKKSKLEEVKKGANIDGLQYQPAKIKFIKTIKNNSWFEVELTEGKNREIRRLFEYANMGVSRLIRISYGQYELANLESGKVIEVDV